MATSSHFLGTQLATHAAYRTPVAQNASTATHVRHPWIYICRRRQDTYAHFDIMLAQLRVLMNI
jgi:hypothetical protein